MKTTRIGNAELKDILCNVLLILFCCTTQAASATVGPMLEIHVGPGNQSVPRPVFDQNNDRFLVVWEEGLASVDEDVINGQLVNSNGSLYGSVIPIAPQHASYLGGTSHVSAFDHHNERFLVVWCSSHTGQFVVYGQLVSADGSLYEDGFAISPDVADHRAVMPSVQFDAVNSRFLVTWVASASPGRSTNAYAQLVNADSSLYGSLITLTNYTDWVQSAHNVDISFDSLNTQFLITWGSYDYIYGQMVDADGGLRGSQIAVGYYGAGSYPPCLSFDSVNGRFLHTWGGTLGQFVNADGTLFGAEWLILRAGHPSIVFDHSVDKFLLVGDAVGHPDGGIVGLFLNSNGTAFGEDFLVFDPSSPPGREAYMGTYVARVAGSAETGFLVVWEDVPYHSTSGRDIFGTIVKPGPETVSINIDIYPNRTPNRVYLSRNYTIYVAVLGSAEFDVTKIDSSTVKFGRTGTEAGPQREYMLRDLNADGFMDAMFGFSTADCGFQLGDTEGKLTGYTTNGTPIVGVDSVLVSP